MNNNFFYTKSNILEILKITFVVCFALLISKYVPNIILQIGIIPALYAFSAYRNKVFLNIISLSFITVPLSYLLFTDFNQVGIIFQLCLVGIITGNTHSRTKNINTTVLTSIISFVVSTTFFYQSNYDILSINFYTENANLIAQYNPYANMNISVEDIKSTFDMLKPSLIIVTSTTYIIFMIYAFLTIFGINIDQKGNLWNFEYLKMPRLSIIGSIFIIFVIWLISTIFKINAEFIYSNLFFIIITSLFIQGFATFEFFALKKLNRFFKFFIAYFLLFIIAVISYPIFLILGLIDYIFNLRKLDF